MVTSTLQSAVADLSYAERLELRGFIDRSMGGADARVTADP
jgi:hypothetical protein